MLVVLLVTTDTGGGGCDLPCPCRCCRPRNDRALVPAVEFKTVHVSLLKSQSFQSRMCGRPGILYPTVVDGTSSP